MHPKIIEKEIGIIKRAQEGDTHAFEQIFRKYKPFVENLLNSYINDEDESKDLTNVVFLKIWQKLSTFSSYDSFGGWVRIVTTRTAIDYIRKRKHIKLIPEVNDDGLSLDSFGEGTEDDIVNHLTYLQAVEKIKKFPKKKRKIFELFYLENMTIDEISTSLSIPKGTVKAVLSRNRKLLKERL